jgi:outer membrane protein TolC
MKSKTLRSPVIALCLALFGSYVNGQVASENQISLPECYALARANYPLIRKLDLIEKSNAYSLSNASKLYLPQLNVSGQASYQSQVISFADVFPSGLPGGKALPVFSKDQYKIQGELTQTIYDGGSIGNQRTSIKANDAAQKQNIEISLYAVNERINQIYFSILLLEQQLVQNDVRIADLQSTADKTAASLQYGNAYRSNLNELKAEIVNAKMSNTEFRASRSSYMEMLSLLTGRILHDNTRLATPAPAEAVSEVRRPELKLYDLQKTIYDVEEKKLVTDNRPKLNAFFQGGYGRPTLNIIDNNFGAWYITGVRLNWNFGGLYTLKNNRKILAINRQSLDIDKETFLLNTNIALKKDNGDIREYRELIEQDQEAIELRASVKQSSQAQLDNGVITTHDYISQLNAESLARQTLILHKIQLLQAQYSFNHDSGNE